MHDLHLKQTIKVRPIALLFSQGLTKLPTAAVAFMTWPNFPENIIANIAIFLVEYKLVVCWAYRAEKDSYIDMPNPLRYNGGWNTIVALPSKVMIKCSHYLDVSSFPFVVIRPFSMRSMRSLLSPHSVLDILRAISQLCTEAEYNQIIFNPGIGNFRMAVLYLFRSQLWLQWEDLANLRTFTGGSCKLANHIVGITQQQASLANEPVATYVVRCLLACTDTSGGYIRTTNDNNPDGALLFRLFPSGTRLSMTSVCFQHGSAAARVQAGHGREVDIKSLPVTRIPGL